MENKGFKINENVITFDDSRYWKLIESNDSLKRDVKYHRIQCVVSNNQIILLSKYREANLETIDVVNEIFAYKIHTTTMTNAIKAELYDNTKSEDYKDFSALQRIINFKDFIEESNDLCTLMIFVDNGKLGIVKGQIADIIATTRLRLKTYLYQAILSDSVNISTEFPILSSYIRIGYLIRTTIQIQSIDNLITSYYENNNPFMKSQVSGQAPNFSYSNFSMFSTEPGVSCDYRPPFGFACTSSGTGKTQLPFSLKIPALYFLFFQNSLEDKEKIQAIYRPFISISDVFNKCLLHDYTTHGYGYITNNMHDDFWKLKHFKTLGFLVDLLRKLCNIRSKCSDDEPWIVSELRVSGENFDTLTMKESIEQINNMFIGQQKPAIFLDECQLTMNSLISKQRYLFVRTFMRKLGIFAIFMGTNASLMNFISRSENGGSRSEGSIRPWCYIIHDLSPYSRDLLDERIAGLKQILLGNIPHPSLCNSKLFPPCKATKMLNVKHRSYEEIESFIEFIRAILMAERPLFCKYTLDRLQCHLQLNGYEFDQISVLEDIIFTLFKTFMNAKRPIMFFEQSSDYIDYNRANLAIIFAKCSTKTMNGIINVEKKECAAIHKHIAYLSTNGIIDKFFPTFFSLYTNYKQNLCLLQEDLKGRVFEASYSFATFNEEPLSLLSFIGITNYEEIFVQQNDENLEIRCSLARVFIDCVESNASKHEAHTVNRGHYDGGMLEDLTSAISLMSTHSEGFKGVSFENWLCNFISEFYFDSIISESKRIKPTIICSEAFWMKNKGDTIPFCSPSLNTEWDRRMVPYLDGIGCKIGVCNITGDFKPRDFSIERQYMSNDSICSEPVLYCECKLRQSGLTNINIVEIIKKLTDVNKLPSQAKWNVIVANDIKEFTEEIKNINVYRLIKANINEFELVLVSDGQKNDSCQGFVLIDIKIIDEIMYEKIQDCFTE